MTTPANGADSSLWAASREKREPASPLDGDVTVDVAIIGAGYTGLATSYHLKAADSGLSVAVLEAERAGFGASGRNAGFVMTLFGASVGLMKALYGKDRVREAHHYMTRAIDAMEALIAEHAIDCDFERRGFLKVATAPAYVGRIKDEIELFHSLGVTDVEWIDRDAVWARVHGPGYLGAAWEPACALLNPVKWADGLRRIATAKGARLYEGTRVTKVSRAGGRYRLSTPGGTVTADKVVYATNGYTHLIPGMRLKQLPAFAYIIATEPLNPEQRAALGWEGREGIEDGRNFMHFYRLTPDNRLLVGGGPGFVPFGTSMANDASPLAWDHLEGFIHETFPRLGPLRVTHRWGGAFSVTADSTPQIGTLDGGDAVFSIGCTGHGVAMTHMNGQIIRDLVLGRKTDLTDLWFVNRRTLPLPPEPLRWLASRAVIGAMKADDWWCDRGAE